jgi:hypothetical protein
MGKGKLAIYKNFKYFYFLIVEINLLNRGIQIRRRFLKPSRRSGFANSAEVKRYAIDKGTL